MNFILGPYQAQGMAPSISAGSGFMTSRERDMDFRNDSLLKSILTSPSLTLTGKETHFSKDAILNYTLDQACVKEQLLVVYDLYERIRSARGF